MPEAPQMGSVAQRAFVIALLASLGACAAPGLPAGQPQASPRPVEATGAQSIALTNPGFESERPGIGDNPEGWAPHQHAGPTAYSFTLDRSTKHSGETSMRIRNLRPEVYGSITQSIPAAPHVGKTLRFSVWLRTDDVVANEYGKGATPILQAIASGSPVASASFEIAAIAGTNEWIRREVVIDIPRHADAVEFGVMLTGTGIVWLDDAALEAPVAAPR
jgi:hypothetical protein